MPKLKIAFLAGALAVAGSAALAVELPDTGSKNFSRGRRHPELISTMKRRRCPRRTADTTERDWSAVDEAAPAQPMRSPRSASCPWAPTRPVRHRPQIRLSRCCRREREAAAGRVCQRPSGTVGQKCVARFRRASARHGKSGAPTRLAPARRGNATATAASALCRRRQRGVGQSRPRRHISGAMGKIAFRQDARARQRFCRARRAPRRHRARRRGGARRWRTGAPASDATS